MGSRFNFSTGLFMGVQELKKFQTFLKEYESIIKGFIGSYGIFDKKGSFTTNFEVSMSTASEINIGAGTAIDESLQIIDIPAQIQVSVPTDNVWRDVVIKWVESTNEAGTVDLAADGTMTGNGTDFIDTIRGLPNFPAVVSFEKADGTSSINIGEFSVNSVSSNTLATLNVSNNFQAETGVKYRVVGTFTPASSPNVAAKYPFRYNSYDVRIEASPTINANYDFVIARVRSDGATLKIEDKRSEFFKTNAGFDISKIFGTNPLIGIKWAKSGFKFQGGGSNRVRLEWGFEATTFTLDFNNKSISITAGSGGTYANTAAVNDDDFNNWRVYSKVTKKWEIIEDTTESGGTITLNLKQLRPDHISALGDLYIVPDVPLIKIEYGARNAANTIVMTEGKLFPVSDFFGEMEIPYNDTITKGIFGYYYMTNEADSPALGVFPTHNYENESSYDEDGEIGTSATTSYSSTGNGYVPAKLANNFFEKKAWINQKNIFTATNAWHFPAAVDIATSGTLTITSGNYLRVTNTNNAPLSTITHSDVANGLVLHLIFGAKTIIDFTGGNITSHVYETVNTSKLNDIPEGATGVFVYESATSKWVYMGALGGAHSAGDVGVNYFGSKDKLLLQAKNYGLEGVTILRSDNNFGKTKEYTLKAMEENGEVALFKESSAWRIADLTNGTIDFYDSVSGTSLSGTITTGSLSASGTTVDFLKMATMTFFTIRIMGASLPANQKGIRFSLDGDIWSNAAFKPVRRGQLKVSGATTEYDVNYKITSNTSEILIDIWKQDETVFTAIAGSWYFDIDGFFRH